MEPRCAPDSVKAQDAKPRLSKLHGRKVGHVQEGGKAVDEERVWPSGQAARDEGGRCEGLGRAPGRRKGVCQGQLSNCALQKAPRTIHEDHDALNAQQCAAGDGNRQVGGIVGI